MKKYYNQKRLKGLTFSEGSMVYLAIKNIIIKRLNKKLDYKYLGLYKVIKRISENNYQLDLLPKVRIHLIFYISLLENVINVELINTGQDNVKIDKKKYEVKKVFGTRNYQKRIEYLVKWKGYKDSENIWEPVNYLINA